jgi:threonine dehydrogenase-like Zn-dependent dehydrogenase
MECVKSGGQVLVIGLHEQKVPVDFLNLLHREIELRGVFSSYNEFKEVLDLMALGKVQTDLFISDVISLVDIVEKGFERLVGSRDLVKILVKVGESWEADCLGSTRSCTGFN